MTTDAVSEGAAQSLPPLTEGVTDEFVPVASFGHGVLQAGIDDITLVGDLDPRCVPKVKLHVEGAPRNRWGAFELGSPATFGGGWDPLLSRHRAYYKPESSRLFVQAKLAPKGRVLPPGLLMDAVRNLEVTFAYHGVLVAADTGWSVSRLDVAVDLVMKRPSEGKLLLDALRAVRLPRGWYAEQSGPRTPTTYHRLPKGSVGARCYSRHRETGLQPWRVIRLERQVVHKPRRPLQELTVDAVKSVWTDHFGSVVPSSGSVKVGSQEAVIMELADRVERGELSFGRYEQAVGYLLAERLGRAEELYPAKRLQERRRLCRELGVELGGFGVDELVVELGELIDGAAGSARWDAAE